MEMGSFSSGSSSPKSGGVVGVKYHAFNQPGKHAGKTVGELRGEYGSLWSIPADATAFVNDKKVDDNTTLAEGDQLVFHRKSGDKGS